MTLPDATGTVRIGVVGPRDVVHRMVDVGHRLVMTEATTMSLTSTSYQNYRQIPGRVRGIAEDVDVLLFAGPLPYDMAKDAGVLTRPATFVELSGSSLYGAMLRTIQRGDVDLRRVSIDSLHRDAIAEAYDECDISHAAVHAMPYEGPESALQFARFHRELFEQGRTGGALTTVDAVDRELRRAKVPTVRIRATGSALRASLRTATFLGAGSMLGEAQVVVGVVEIPEVPRRPGTDPRGAWAATELRMEVVRALRPEADRLAISLMPRTDTSVALVATLGSITEATQGFTRAPFVTVVRRATGVTPYVGLGTGATAAAAETNAERALVDARASGAARVYVRLRDGSTMAMNHGTESAPADAPMPDPRRREALATLRAGLADEGSDDAKVVDAKLAAELLGTSPRTARRVLQDLARDGLAWPVPPAAALSRGRPRQTYRLVNGR
ncbi:transcriptional regulator [Labedaea rhizosphaerae]|uniref:Transcriptional regulator n=1 Tax=Labedaea rhizosphaerae TaxID=598644 RepID=A0A4R6S7P2_LABRH|nr:transcriptional regulator [Labedaea rhizosphaerae]TDP94846.1 hypothetical protein EV186_10578 [Labedaea rhizosphaerae]